MRQSRGVKSGITVWRVQSVTREILGQEELSRAPKLFWTPGSLVLSLCKLESCAANVVINIIEQNKLLAGLVLAESSRQNTVISKFWRKYRLF